MLSASMHADLVTTDETLREPERLGDAPGLILVAVGEPVDAVFVTVAEQAKELAGVRAAGDEHQLVDAGAARAPRPRTSPSAGRRAAGGACS